MWLGKPGMIERTMGFDVQGASRVGLEHVRKGRNNQDAFAYTNLEDVLVVAVSDGSSSTPCSEVGSNLAVRWVIHRAGELHALGRLDDHDAFAATVSDELPRWLHTLAAELTAPGQSLLDPILDMFPFTLLVAVADKQKLSIYACGDGTIRVDGEELVLATQGHGPAAPSIVTRGLPIHEVGAAAATASLVRVVQRESWTTAIVATDGAEELRHPENSEEPLFVLFERERPLLKSISRFEEAMRRSVARHGGANDDATVVVMGSRPLRRSSQKRQQPTWQDCIVCYSGGVEVYPGCQACLAHTSTF